LVEEFMLLANVANYFLQGHKFHGWRVYVMLMLLIIFYRDTNSMVEEFILLANVANYFLQGHKFHGWRVYVIS
jgi:exoribonuclease R